MEKKHENEEIYDKALMTAEFLSEDKLRYFYEWGFEKFPDFHAWKKLCWDKGPFTQQYHDCTYNVIYKQNDTITISFSRGIEWMNDFPLSYSLDTSAYDYLVFHKLKNSTITIQAHHKKNDTIISTLATNLSFDDVFKERNPFVEIEFLDNLAEKAGIVKSDYRSQTENFIQFYLTEVDILTFLPDNYHIHDVRKERLEKEFSAGVKVKPNWNLRKINLDDHSKDF